MFANNISPYLSNPHHTSNIDCKTNKKHLHELRKNCGKMYNNTQIYYRESAKTKYFTGCEKSAGIIYKRQKGIQPSYSTTTENFKEGETPTKSS